MQVAPGKLVEIFTEQGLTGGRLLCPQNLIPAPGQYLLAHEPESDVLLPAPVYNAGPIPGGFLFAPPIPVTWQPGVDLSLRGPLGRGFSVPAAARCVALVALGDTAARLNPLLGIALGQGAAVVLVSDLELHDLPLEVEIQPVAALAEVTRWADYSALDLNRESLPGLREKLGLGKQVGARQRAGEAQALIHTAMPCGALADCGVCAVTVPRGWKMACKDGPVFDLDELI